jgi:hypothetical protein
MNFMRLLHLVHSFDVLMSYRSTNPGRKSRSIAFVLKFALFVLVNSLSHFSSVPFPPLTLDAIVLSDFISLFLCLEMCWSTWVVDSALRIIKGKAAQLSRIELAIRFFHYTLFTIFRVIMAFSIIEKFGINSWQCILVCLLFMEFNGVVLKLMTGERTVAKVFSTFAESLVVSCIVVPIPQFFTLLPVILIKRHLISQIARA